MFAFRHNDLYSEQHQTLCLGLRMGSVLSYVISSIIYKLVTECLDLNRSTQRNISKLSVLVRCCFQKFVLFYRNVVLVIKPIKGPLVRYFVICYEECRQSEQITRNMCNFMKRMLNKEFTDLIERPNALLRNPNLLNTKVQPLHQIPQCRLPLCTCYNGNNINY